MKTFQDVQDKLRVELIHWFPIQCREEYEDFYLYYKPTTERRNGEIGIYRDSPNNEYEIGIRVRKDLTIDQNHKLLSEYCWRLPILEV